MSMCYEDDFAYIPRAAALLAVYMYMVFIVRYLCAIIDYPSVKMHTMLGIFLILAIISWPQIIQKDAVTFAMTPWGYWYYSKMSLARIMQFLSVLLGIVEYYKIMSYGRKNAGSMRERNIIKRNYFNKRHVNY